MHGGTDTIPPKHVADLIFVVDLGRDRVKEGRDAHGVSGVRDQ